MGTCTSRSSTLKAYRARSCAAPLGRLRRTGRLESMHSAAIDKEGNAPHLAVAAMIYEHGVPTATVGISPTAEKIQAKSAWRRSRRILSERKQALLASLQARRARAEPAADERHGYGELLIRRCRRAPPSETPHRSSCKKQSAWRTWSAASADHALREQVVRGRPALLDLDRAR